MSAEAKAIGDHMNAGMVEFFDGYVLVGFIAGTGEALTIRNTPTGENREAICKGLNALLVRAVMPVPVQKS